MAEWLSFFAALVIVGCFLILARFIVNLGIMEREAMFNVTIPRRDIPSQPMVGVKNPFNLKLKAASTADTGVIQFLLSTTASCYVTFYWEVQKNAIASILCNSDKQQRSNFDDYENDSSSDSDLEEVPTMSALPLEHFLQGSYKERGASEFYDSGSDHEILAVPPADLQYVSSSSSSSNPAVTTNHSVYSLVVTVEMCRKDELGPDQLSDIVALMTAVQVSSSVVGKLAGNIVMQFVRTAEGSIYSMKKLFVVESDDITETQLESSSPSPSAQITSSAEHSNLPSTSSELMNCVCIICRSLPVTRAFLPCRHACVCGLCFQQLSYCPMCRAHIQSYFIVQEESFMDNAESHTTTELQGMSVGEILRGVFSAS